jgi:uncharacterized protein (TIGR04255 family)
MTRRIYPKPPIVEAVISLHFGAEIDPKALVNTLSDALRHRYDASELRAADLVQASVRAELSGGVSTSAQRVPHMLFLQSASGLRLLGCGSGVLSIHTLAPYPGWESFIDQAVEAVEALPQSIRSSSLTRVGIRVIDLIRLPPNVEYQDFFTIIAPRPPALPDALSNYYHFVQSFDPDDGTVAQLTVVNTAVADHPGVALLYDLSLYHAGDPLTDFASDAWRTHIEAMHIRLRDIFEGSITDKTRALFQ